MRIVEIKSAFKRADSDHARIYGEALGRRALLANRNWLTKDEQHARLETERKLVVATFRKRLTFREFESYTQLLRANPLFKPAFSEIADISRVEEINLQVDEFVKLADGQDPFSLNAWCAFVAHGSV